MALPAKVNKALNVIYPYILILTGSAIFMVGISTIAVLTKFASFNLPWVYHFCVISVFIAATWWLFYFIYRGLGLIHQYVQKPILQKEVKQ